MRALSLAHASGSDLFSLAVNHRGGLLPFANNRLQYRSIPTLPSRKRLTLPESGCSCVSLVPEEFTLNHFVNDVPNRIVVLSHPLEDGFYLFPIGELDFGTG